MLQGKEYNNFLCVVENAENIYRKENLGIKESVIKAIEGRVKNGNM